MGRERFGRGVRLGAARCPTRASDSTWLPLSPSPWRSRMGALAATLAAQALEGGDEQDRTAVSIVQRWVQKSPQAAAAWVAQFPEGPARAAALQNLLGLWAAQDAEAAGHWLLELPAGSLRDAGMTGLCSNLGRRRPNPGRGGTCRRDVNRAEVSEQDLNAMTNNILYDEQPPTTATNQRRRPNPKNRWTLEMVGRAEADALCPRISAKRIALEPTHQSPARAGAGAQPIPDADLQSSPRPRGRLRGADD